MICPNCNAKIPDDALYCEKCGCEFQLVADMDVDFEVSMDDTLTDIAQAEFGYEKKKPHKDIYEDMEYDDDPSIIGLLLRNPKTGWIFYIFVAIVLAGLIFAIVKLSSNMSKENSKEYQLQLSEEAIANNDIEGAIKALENAYKADKTDYNILFDIADYYYTLSRNDDAINTLKAIALSADFTYDVRETAYRKIISLYKALSMFEDINELLIDCDLASITDEFSSFMAPDPEFSLESGTYTETIALKLSANSTGKIYYTTDGTVPSTNSTVYDSPLFLEYGSYTIQAMFVNEYGATSNVVKGTYLIDVAFSFEPDVHTESGNYDCATLIEVDVPVMYTVYYTSDGSTPDKTSNKYQNPFPMPIGASEFKFISYAGDGTESSVVTKNYFLAYPDGTMTPAEAVDRLVEGLVERGHLDDTNGTKEGVDGRYLYIYVAPYPIENVGDVYFVVEYFEDSYGNTRKSNVTYGVDVKSGQLYIVNSLGLGTYDVTYLE